LYQFLKREYDIILMDMQMPVMDGYKATKSIRAHENISMRRHTPIVALTAHTLEEEVKKCLDAGCDIHISKPVRKRELINKLDEMMKAAISSSNSSRYSVREAYTASTGDAGTIVEIPADLEPMIPGYLKNRRRDLARIRHLVKSEEYDEIKQLAHRMKGSGGGYGFDRITESAGEMEQAAALGSREKIAEEVDRLMLYLDSVTIRYVEQKL
jgi:CheY-like chemotaxis protein